MKKALIGLFALSGLVATAPAVSAAPITVLFTGVIDSASPFFANGNLTGSYTYDTSLSPDAGSNSQNTYYTETTGLSFSILDSSNALLYSGSSSSYAIQLNNEGGSFPDRYAVVAGQAQGVTGSPNPPSRVLTLFFISLLDSTQATIADAFTTSLNPTSPTHTFDSRTFGLDFTSISDLSIADIQSVSGTITSLRIPAQADPTVPEPTTMVLLGSGVLMAARRRIAKRG